MNARVYGATCALCGSVMIRGPADADVCAGCQSGLRRAER